MRSLVFALLLFSAPEALGELNLTAADTSSTEKLDVNHLTAAKICSHGDKEWYICTQPEGWGGMFYCPAYSDYNETELASVEWGALGVPTPLMPCFTCPRAPANCSTTVAEVMTAAGIPSDQNVTLGPWGVWDDAQYYCEELCEMGKEGESCTQDSYCTSGELFCDYEPDNLEEGTCRKCPIDPAVCIDETFALTEQGRLNCRECYLGCYGAAASNLLVDGESIPSQPIDATMQTSKQSATGRLIDCSELTLDTSNLCANAEGKICVVYFEVQYAIPWQVSNQAERSGCAGIIAFLPGFYDAPMAHSDSALHIPMVFVTREDGENILNDKLGVNATVEVNVFGSACYPSDGSGAADVCDAAWPCDAGDFCEYNSVPIETGSGVTFEYTLGNCRPCPFDENDNPKPIACYFDDRRDGISETVETISTKTVQKVQECASTCGAVLSSDGCKFCSDKVTGFEFAMENEDEGCILCPDNDMIYPDRIVPLFGDDIKCWQLESFFARLPVKRNSRNCELSQAMNFICGCDGTGYMGANTQSKRAALTWVPRVSAILSMLGSLFIIADTQRTRPKRSKLINKILCSISVFDFIGSFAMAFTTLPTPSTDYIYGGKGNDATCTAQGFLIQIGTIACFLGVSLALYYDLTIKQGWSESKMKRRRIVYFLLIPPVVIGFLFAGISIPYYDNVMVWCNNSARYWPEVPVILSILYTTVVMSDVTFNVYKKERASSRYTGGSNKYSKMVFKQAIFFVGAFYITWVPYLALSYMNSVGTGYANYGLTLAASTMVPLQGFWNFWVYAKPRYFGKGKSVVGVLSLGFVSRLRNLSSRRSTSQSGPPEIAKKTATTKAGCTTNNSSMVKSSTVKSSVAMESELPVAFGEPDEPAPDAFGEPDGPKVVAFGEEDEVVPFDADAHSAHNGNSNEDDAK